MRGIAALMVVIGHSQSAVATVVTGNGSTFTRLHLLPWGAGVDLFFVISGFIMVHASARLFGRPGSRGEFLRRRLIRIVPLYWLVTTMFLALLAGAALKGGDLFPDGRAILASYAFLPVETYAGGGFFPVFDLGWTLNYEMFFYALFCVVVAWPRDRALPAIGALLIALVVAGVFVPGPSAGWYWTRPIILDFGLGIAVGALVTRRLELPQWGRLGLAVLGATLLLADPAHVFDGPAGTTVANAWPRVLFAGVPVAAILMAAVLGRQPKMPRVGLPLVRMGDASYSFYLFHPLALITMEKLAQKLSAVREAPGFVLVSGTVVLAMIIAVGAHFGIERPMTAILARKFAPRTPPAPLVVMA